MTNISYRTQTGLGSTPTPRCVHVYILRKEDGSAISCPLPRSPKGGLRRSDGNVRRLNDLPGGDS